MLPANGNSPPDSRNQAELISSAFVNPSFYVGANLVFARVQRRFRWKWRARNLGEHKVRPYRISANLMQLGGGRDSISDMPDLLHQQDVVGVSPQRHCTNKKAARSSRSGSFSCFLALPFGHTLFDARTEYSTRSALSTLWDRSSRRTWCFPIRKPRPGRG